MLTGAYTGGSTILSLNLQWDQGTSGASWTTIIGVAPFSTTQTYSVTGSSITAGMTYKFRYRAINVFGWGPFSDSVDIIAAEIPDQMAPVIVTQIGTSVQFAWTPLSDNSNSVSQFKIEFLTSDGVTLVTDLNYCDGTNSEIILNNYCIFPMSVFMASPYNLI